jgi:RES domain-containing protein
VKIWRIASETRTYKAHDLSGMGAAKYPGRWNTDGDPVVYCATTIALAALETAAHIDSGLPLNRFVIEIEVPAHVWDAREHVEPRALPVTWAAIPAGVESVKFGSEWLACVRSALLLVPSVIVPEERVVLVNPKHADAAKISARTLRAFDYKPLFRSVK